MSTWTEGVCGDGAAILRDGVMVPIEEVIECLNRAEAPGSAPTEDAAFAMGSTGAPASEAERLAFEAWMRGHSWMVTGTWDGSTYADRPGHEGWGYDHNTLTTRMLWAVWRDRAALAAPSFDTPELRAIGERLRTQDNRITADPIFLIRGLKRVYGMDPATHDYYIWVDTDNSGEEVEAPEDEENPPKNLEKCYYMEHWVTLKMAFTQHGCEEHLRINGHNYKQSYKKVDIFADSLWRMPEMIVIRNALMALPPPEPQA